MNTYTFISYQTKDKSVAGSLQRTLADVGVESFLAHEDIDVSQEWRKTILEEIAKAGIFICILSEHYYESEWCVQESGIAAFRSDMTIIPLSLHGNIPKGFIAHIQSTKIVPEGVSIHSLLPGLVKHDFNFGVDIIITIIGASKSYRSAEDNFRMIQPYVDRLSDEQGKRLLEESQANTHNQVCYADECARVFIPPILNKYGYLLAEDVRNSIEKSISKT